MKLYKIIFLLFFIYSNIFNINSQIKFNPIALNEDNRFLFNSQEILGGKEYNKTLFYGTLNDNKIDFKALSFYPEKLYYSNTNNTLYIYNKMGLYKYNLNDKKVIVVNNYPNFALKDEYNLNSLPEINFSPNFKYLAVKIKNSSLKSSIYLFNLIDNTNTEIIKDIDIKPAKNVCLWSPDSYYFIYEKNNKIYYFSILDFERKKNLQEDWREIGSVNLSNAGWTGDNYLYWVEKNYIYKADSNQFFSRSIYKNYLRQGNIVKKIPFKFDQAFDQFYINCYSKKFSIIKNNNFIFYCSLADTLNDNIYLQLKENYQVEKCKILDSGEAIFLLDKLLNGKIIKEILFVKKNDNGFYFKPFDSSLINSSQISNFSISNDSSRIVLNANKGAYCFEIATLNKVWSYEKEQIISSINIESNQWILGGVLTTFATDPSSNLFNPILASSFKEAGLINKKIYVNLNNEKYYIDENNITLSLMTDVDSINSNTSENNNYRLISREINKGFYKEGIYLKELYSGEYIEIIGEPKLRYTLYQPEIKIGSTYYESPSKEKYEIALVFNCTKTSEGLFNILTKLNELNIKTTFFLNGSFMEINPVITKEISNFNHEIGNMFQLNINLTDNNYLIDKNFIRQGLSANEELFHRLTGKNFNPIWHSPMYMFNDTLIKYGQDSGYNFVSYNLDSLDWVGENNSELNKNFYMSNSQLIERILKNVKPGQIIIFNTGKNDSIRNEWLFQDIDLLISELIRSGYSFTTASDILKKYRD